MTIHDALQAVDALKPNLFPLPRKIAWLSDLDGLIWREIVQTHEGAPAERPCPHYTEDTSMDTVLLAPEPYTEVYRYYMSAQMDIANRETGEYTKDMTLFNSAWQTLCDYWNRTYMPRSPVRQLRL